MQSLMEIMDVMAVEQVSEQDLGTKSVSCKKLFLILEGGQ
jgi:hypothetical protein